MVFCRKIWNKTLKSMIDDAYESAKTKGVGRAYQSDNTGNTITCIVKIDPKNSKVGYKQYWEINHVRVPKKSVLDNLEYYALKAVR